MSPLTPGQMAPDFSLGDLFGRLHQLSEQRGRVVVMEFWSAECPWVARVDALWAAELAQLDGSVVHWCIAANTNEAADLLRTAAQERGVATVLVDANQQVADSYGAQVTPQFFVIDQTGVLRYQGAYDDLTFRQRTPRQTYLPQAVQALLLGSNPDPVETPAFGCTIVRQGE